MQSDDIQRPPNVLLVVADDLGWSDIGAFGGEIRTPHLDELCRRGVRLTNFHASPVCSTTRAMLMTGCDHHEVGLGTMAEVLAPEQRGRPGYEGYLNDRALTIAERLREAGYYSVMSGKWHLGLNGESPPSRRGFDRTFALFQGEHNHYGNDQSPETAGHVGPARYELDGRPVEFPVGDYSTDVFSRQIDRFIIEAPRDRPLFAYLAFTAPHCPLQADASLVAEYAGMYDEGPDVLRARRLAQIRALGLSVGERPPAVLRGVDEWDRLMPQEREHESRKMEIYAAMVEAMDAAIGRTLGTLKEAGQLENTIVLFMSDNGPAGLLREKAPGWKEWIEKNADNTLGNLGKATSFVSIGPRWAQAQATPFSLFKRFTTEGGVRTCALVAGPGIASRQECKEFIHVMDLAPTFLDFAGLGMDSPVGKLQMRGSSAKDALTASMPRATLENRAIGWELSYARAIQKGTWKAVWMPAQTSRVFPEIPIEQWMLFDMATDPGENNDLALLEPHKLRELIEEWNKYAAETGVVV